LLCGEREADRQKDGNGIKDKGIEEERGITKAEHRKKKTKRNEEINKMQK